ncbi:hypothetical protein ARMGADRAFT_1086967 [Armillaria gallica]|uniref:Uncharacterized protein n=1 Tax=Armillaria gallica TaxID=47427 RepID=A0A2H3CWR7_ARMGA|nr:hypothetical protein ARMGADRAFT_1086967 [Armillaria gallica]
MVIWTRVIRRGACKADQLQQTPSLTVKSTHMRPSTWATIRDFLAAARAALYRDSGTRDVCDLEKPRMFIATLRDLTRSPSHSLPLNSTLRHHSTFGLRHIEFGTTRLSGQAETELLTWLDGETNVVSLRFPILVDDDDDASPPMPLPATPTRTRLLSMPTTPSQPCLFPMPPLSPLPTTPTPTKDTFTHHRHSAP